MRQFRLVSFLPLLLGAVLFGFCGDQIATRMGVRGWEHGYLVGYGVAPILFLCPAFLAWGQRLKGLEDKVRELEARVSGRDDLAP
jgi:hypothetical protein